MKDISLFITLQSIYKSYGWIFLQHNGNWSYIQ
jgi:hypothetical protein